MSTTTSHTHTSGLTEPITVERPATLLPPLVLPGSPSYDRARQSWNLAVDQRPAAVCTATRVEHVQAAIAYAREHGWRIAPQTTGHLSETLPSLEDTLLLRLALHDGTVEVDPAARVARIAAGALWGDVVQAVTPHGLAVMHGSSPSVGVIGYLLAGGLSFYGRRHGLAVNHVRAFEVVTLDGVLRRVDADHEPDLFYALRGGGGGYAIVTAVELRLLPYTEVTGGAMFFDIAHGMRVMRAWRDWTTDASDAMTTTFRVLNLPPLPMIPEPLRERLTVCVNGVSLDPAEAARLETALRYAAEPILGGFGPMPTAAVARLHADPEDPVPAHGDGMLLHKLDDWASETFFRVAGEGSGSPLLSAELRHLGGALAAPPAGAGARGHLEGRFLLFGVGIPGALGTPEELDAHLDQYLRAMAPWATGTRFTSFAERQRTLAGCVPDDALRRLVAIRDHYDPEGVLLPAHVATKGDLS